jgi:signal peptidase II
MMARATWIGLATGAAGIAIDQAHKVWMLGPYAIAEKGRVAVAPFLDLVMVWNRGVSYGLLTQDGELGRLLLIGFGLIGALVFGLWLFRTRQLLTAVSLGLIMAGALSNAIDRIVHGAVADFFLLHAGGFEWYVFNLADVWIVAGVAGLLLATLTERREIATET